MDYTSIPSAEIVDATAAAMRERGIIVVVVNTKEEAFAKVKELIPAAAAVMNGSSTTLNEIGFVDYLKSDQHGWNNLHAAIVAEQDAAKQAQLRQESTFAQYFLGSVHAITQSGEALIASASGSQLPSYTFTSPNVIWVASTNKIVPTLNDGLMRIREHVFPLEDARMKSVGYPGSVLAKILIFEREAAMMGRKVTMILVNEKLGF